MAFKVFISHSIKDLNLIIWLKDCLQRNGIETYIFEEYQQPGTRVSEKIAEAIDVSDCVLAFMTKDGSRSQWVHHEVGYAKGKGKMIIPVVEQGVISGGFLEGVEYIPFRRDDPYDAIDRTAHFLSLKKAKKEEEQRSKVVLAGLIVFFGLLALSEQKE